MIYAVSPHTYPNAGQFIEEMQYMDSNSEPWLIARVVSGFFVKFIGEPYFIEDRFEIDRENGGAKQIKNTNCILFDTTDFDTFANVRDIIKENYTDDIWESFEEMFSERFAHSSGMLESEMIA